MMMQTVLGSSTAFSLCLFISFRSHVKKPFWCWPFWFCCLLTNLVKNITTKVRQSSLRNLLASLFILSIQYIFCFLAWFWLWLIDMLIIASGFKPFSDVPNRHFNITEWNQVCILHWIHEVVWKALWIYSGNEFVSRSHITAPWAICHVIISIPTVLMELHILYIK